MSKKVETDLDKMNKDRRKAEEEYLMSMEQKLQVERIKKEGISNAEDIVIYILDVIESVKHSEDLARMSNNPIVYSEAIGIRREMDKLLNLLFTDDPEEDNLDEIDGTEEAHRENNNGDEGYV